jgi:hypothetical protein
MALHVRDKTTVCECERSLSEVSWEAFRSDTRPLRQVTRGRYLWELPGMPDEAIQVGFAPAGPLHAGGHDNCNGVQTD